MIVDRHGTEASRELRAENGKCRTFAFEQGYRPPLFSHVHKLNGIGEASAYVLKGLKFKWLWNVQMRARPT